jgi:hypothetical protein
VLLNNAMALACHSVQWELAWYSEAGASLALLQAGYNLDSLLERYQVGRWRWAGPCCPAAPPLPSPSCQLGRGYAARSPGC